MTRSNGAAKKTGLAWLGLSVVVVVLDQWTKHIALDTLQYADPVAVIPFLNWTLVYNFGAAFSFLSDAGGWQRWFFIILALGISTWLVFWLRTVARSQWLTAAPLALIIGGALGNVIDRFRYGYVVDFIDVYVGDWHWPAFNIADSAVCVGAVALIIFASRDDQGDASAK